MIQKPESLNPLNVELSSNEETTKTNILQNSSKIKNILIITLLAILNSVLSYIFYEFLTRRSIGSLYEFLLILNFIMNLFAGFFSFKGSFILLWIPIQSLIIYLLYYYNPIDVIIGYSYYRNDGGGLLVLALIFWSLIVVIFPYLLGILIKVKSRKYN